MRLEKAIEIKTTYLKGDEAVEHDALIEADGLLIEAGKREVANRENPDFVMVGKLPGETKD